MGDGNGVMSVIDIEAGAGALQQLRCGGSISSLDFAREREAVICADLSGRVTLFDPRVGRSHEEMVLLSGVPVNSVLYIPESQSVLSGDDAGVVRQWDLRKREVRLELRCEGGGDLLEDGCSVLCVAVNSVAYAKHCKSIVCGDDLGKLSIWDEVTGLKQQTLNCGGAINTVAYASDARTMFVGDMRGRITIFSHGSAQGIRKQMALMTCPGVITCIACSTEFEPLLASDSRGNVTVFDILARCKRWEKATTAWINVLISIPELRLAVSGDENGHVIIWEVNTGERRAEAQLGSAVAAIVYARDQRSIIVAESAGQLHVMPLETMKSRLRMDVKAAVTCLAYGAWLHLAVCGAVNGRVVVYDAVRGELRKTFACPELVTAVAFLTENEALAAGDSLGQVTVWDLHGGALKYQVRLHNLDATLKPSSQGLGRGQQQPTRAGAGPGGSSDEAEKEASKVPVGEQDQKGKTGGSVAH
eukprot:TRINITY_DN38279_c0_g1_i2.p1 TRINITY_DN38279_c0_g1~~TRINITY_DN38279_c0_g1_i2.p1  ORF type:complete len:474 (+),score=90.69 TRINITY_DN38279_c0_g1_i2:592-2013(+)